MFLDLRIHTDYDKDINPFVRNGIVIDTCVIKEIVDGIISSRITKKESPELTKIENFLSIIKLNNSWDKFFITPHILTEVCQHIRSDYERWHNHKQIIEEIMPIIKAMGECSAPKDNFLETIEKCGHLAIEAGDISIFVVTDDFINKKEKIAILSNDSGVNDRYKYDERVMVMNYQSVVQNL